MAEVDPAVVLEVEVNKSCAYSFHSEQSRLNALHGTGKREDGLLWASRSRRFCCHAMRLMRLTLSQWREIMSRVVRDAIFVFACNALVTSVALGKDAILPQGDPRIQGTDAAEQDRRDEIRKDRLKQQGQGENYRVEGKLQGGTKGPLAEDSKGHDREGTGIEDPSVNPGQASGLKTVRGRVTKSEENAITIEQANGEETVLKIDPQTRLNADIHPGDRITGTVTNQGRAVMVQEEGKPKP